MGDREQARQGSRQAVKQPSTIVQRIGILDPKSEFDRHKGGGDRPCKNVRQLVSGVVDDKQYSIVSAMIEAIRANDAAALRLILGPDNVKDQSDTQLINAIRHALSHQIFAKIVYDPNLSIQHKTGFMDFVSNEMKTMNEKSLEALQKTYSDAVARNGYSPVDIADGQLHLHQNKIVINDALPVSLPVRENTFQDSSVALKESFSTVSAISFDPVQRTNQPPNYNVINHLLDESERMLKVRGVKKHPRRDQFSNESIGSPFSDYSKPAKSQDVPSDSVYASPIMAVESIKISDEYVRSPKSPKMDLTTKSHSSDSKKQVIRVLHHAVLFGDNTSSNRNKCTESNAKQSLPSVSKPTHSMFKEISKIHTSASINLHGEAAKHDGKTKHTKVPTPGKIKKRKKIEFKSTHATSPQNQTKRKQGKSSKSRKSDHSSSITFSKKSKSAKVGNHPFSSKSAKKKSKKTIIVKSRQPSKLLVSSKPSRIKKQLSTGKKPLNHKTSCHNSSKNLISSKKSPSNNSKSKKLANSKKKKKTPLSLILPSWFGKRKKKKRKHRGTNQKD